MQVGQTIKGSIQAIGTSEPGQNGITYYNIKVNDGVTVHTVRIGAKSLPQVGSPIELVCTNAGGNGKLPYCKKPQNPQYANNSGGFSQGGGNDNAEGKVRHGLACAVLSSGNDINFDYLDGIVKWVMTGERPSGSSQPTTAEEWEEPAPAADDVPF